MTVNLSTVKSVYRQIDTNTRFITTNGAIYVVAELDEEDDTIVLEREHTPTWDPDPDEATLTVTEDELLHHPGFIRVDPHAVANPLEVVFKYAEQHLSDDIRSIGRKHTYNGADVETIGDIDYAIWAATNDADSGGPEEETD